MKFCVQCGYKNEDEAAFCVSCGAAFDPPAPQNDPVPNANSDTRQPLNTAPMLSDNPALHIVKTIGSSTTFLLLAVLFTAYLAFSVISTFLQNPIIEKTTNDTYDIYLELKMANSELVVDLIEKYGADYDIYSSNDLDRFVEDALNRSRDVSVLSSILSFILPALVCIGLWLFFASSQNKQSPSVKTAGLTMIKAFAIVNLIFLIGIPALILILLLIGLAVSSFALGSAVPIIMFFIFLIVIGAVLILPILYFAKIIKSVNTIKRTVATGVPSEKVSTFVIAINYFLAVFSILGSSILLIWRGGVMALPGLCIGVFFIMTSICLSKYRESMLRLTNGK